MASSVSEVLSQISAPSGRSWIKALLASARVSVTMTRIFRACNASTVFIMAASSPGAILPCSFRYTLSALALLLGLLQRGQEIREIESQVLGSAQALPGLLVAPCIIISLDE